MKNPLVLDLDELVEHILDHELLAGPGSDAGAAVCEAALVKVEASQRMASEVKR